MTDAPAADAGPWQNAVLAASLFAVDPAGLGGISVRAGAGPVRAVWLRSLLECLPESAPVRKMPYHITDGRLLGGLDLAATLRAGRPVAEQGLLAEADGGVVILAMAERLTPALAARLAMVLDTGEVMCERDGFAVRVPARFGVIALDEGLDADERPPAAILDRLAFQIDLGAVRSIVGVPFDARRIGEARSNLDTMEMDDTGLDALCATAMAFGIASIRAPLLAMRAARTIAAFEGRRAVSGEDIAAAARLVFSPRAEVLPADPTETEDEPEETPPEEPEAQSEPDTEENSVEGPLEDKILEAVKTAIPDDLLSELMSNAPTRTNPQSRGQGRAGQIRQSRKRGRPAGIRHGEPRGGHRLNLVETLRAAAPWQPLRRSLRDGSDRNGRVEVRPDDFRVTRFKHRAETLTIFVVDASGSSALHRLGEAKGAVELLLADAYVRRDEVALIAFRDKAAEVILPPTRSLARAKKCLAGLPGGGGTPLASGLDAAFAMALAARRKGQTPSLVILTDGQPNIARDGTADRELASENALTAGRLIRGEGFGAAVIDTAARVHPFTERLASDMGAHYTRLPKADAKAVSRAIRETVAPETQPV